jgi:translation initiation factor 1
VSDGNSRLVYSTGGDAPARDKPAKAAKAAAPTPGGHGVRLRLERRASDRLMTLVSGLPGPRRELEQMLRQLKAACGAGGALKDGVLELQGDQRDKVEALLLARGIAWKRAGG